MGFAQKLKRAYGEKWPLPVLSKVILSEVLIKTPFLLPKYYILSNNNGYKIYINLRESPMMIKRWLNVYEYWHQQIFHRIVKPNMTIIDVGANKGDYSLLSAELMKDKGRVLAIEPEPTNCEWIRKSVDANNFKSIKVFEIALYDKNGIEQLNIDKKVSGGHSLIKFEGSEETIPVKTRRLDDFLEEEKISKVDILKIDVQGTELSILKGAEKTIKNNDLHIFIDLDNQKTKYDVLNLLLDNGYKVFSIGKDLKDVKSINDIKGVNSLYAIKS